MRASPRLPVIIHVGWCVGVLLGVATEGEAGLALAENTTQIDIPTQGNATPFPSTATMSGLPVNQYVTRVTVALGPLTHPFASDVNILLVAPTGQTVKLMAGAGGDQTAVNLQFDDCVQTLLPRTTTLSGIYRSSNFVAHSLFPVSETGSSLLSFVGCCSHLYNGAWSLYVLDDTPGFGGSIAYWQVLVHFSPTQPKAPSCAPDFNLDGVPDLVVAAGPGGGPHVQVISGRTGAPLLSFYAYTPGFTGGVHVAACDFNGGGVPDIVTGPGPGGGPHVRVFDGETGQPLFGPLEPGFFAYSPGFTGGVFVGCADMNGDGVPDIITGAGPGGGPHVRVFDGRTGAPLAGILGAGFLPYPPGFTGGVFVGP